MAGVIMIAGSVQTLHARGASAPDLNVAGTSEQIQRGRAISDGFCSACHSRTGTLTGGLDVGEDLPMSIGSFVSSNLTPAGQLSRWSDGKIFRAIRNSVDRDGRWPDHDVLQPIPANSAMTISLACESPISAACPPPESKPGNPPDHLNLLGIMMLVQV
jgi:hypothetical protein